MINLLNETIDYINDCHKSVDDIIFIGSENSGHSCTWDEFRFLANFDYHEGFGSQQIATDLIIAFSDGSRMFREEYDGSEQWAYMAPFNMPENRFPIHSLKSKAFDWYCTLEECQ